MSGTSQVVNPQSRPAAVAPVEATPAKRARRKRAPSKARPVFIVAQVLDDGGQPMQFSKKNLKILSVELNAEKVLEITEGGEHKDAFYLRLVVPPRQAQRPMSAGDGVTNATSPAAA